MDTFMEYRSKEDYNEFVLIGQDAAVEGRTSSIFGDDFHVVITKQEGLDLISQKNAAGELVFELVR